MKLLFGISRLPAVLPQASLFGLFVCFPATAVIWCWLVRFWIGELRLHFGLQCDRQRDGCRQLVVQWIAFVTGLLAAAFVAFVASRFAMLFSYWLIPRTLSDTCYYFDVLRYKSRKLLRHTSDTSYEALSTKSLSQVTSSWSAADICTTDHQDPPLLHRPVLLPADAPELLALMSQTVDWCFVIWRQAGNSVG